LEQRAATGLVITPVGARRDRDMLIVDLAARVPAMADPYCLRKLAELLSDVPGRAVVVSMPNGAEPEYRRRRLELPPPGVHVNPAEYPAKKLSTTDQVTNWVVTTFVCAAHEFPAGDYEIRLTGTPNTPSVDRLLSAGVRIDVQPRRIRVE
jgi:hypothetical protein